MLILLWMKHLNPLNRHICNIKKLCTFPTDYIHVFDMIFTIKTIVYPYRIERLFFLMEAHCVPSAAGTDSVLKMAVHATQRREFCY